jgi:steroid 5-alpha reductase family enzyme
VNLPELFLITGAVIVATMVLLWLASLALRNASIVDPFWGTGFTIVAWTAFIVAGDRGNHDLVLAMLVTIWGTRLSGYLLWRSLGKEEDYRYQAFRRRWGSRFWIVSLITVFLLQGMLLWIVSLPVQVAMLAPGAVGVLTGDGIAIWATGLAFETIGDWQLARFKADPANKGKVMDRGLWRYTRHPNYFGDFCAWWGIFIAALDAPGTAWTIIGPMLMSWLLIRVSGVAMLEKTISKRRPGYDDYAARTNAFFPGPARRD